MTKDVTTVESAVSLDEAARVLACRMVSCVVVVCDGEPVGMITEGDLPVQLAFCGGAEASRQRVEDVMSSPIVSLGPDATLADAVRLCHDRGVRHLPVLDADGGLVGIVTQTDLLYACARALRLLEPRDDA